MPQALNLRTTGLFSWSMKCVYHVFTQSVYHVTLDTMRAPTNGTINRNLDIQMGKERLPQIDQHFETALFLFMTKKGC